MKHYDQLFVICQPMRSAEAHLHNPFGEACICFSLKRISNLDLIAPFILSKHFVVVIVVDGVTGE